MISQQTKDYAKHLVDEESWVKLLILIIQFGRELIAFIKDYKQQKRNDKAKDKDQGTKRPYSETLS